MMKRQTVAIWGGTGATGDALIRAAILDGSIARVRAFTRRPLETCDPTVDEVVVSDFRDETELAPSLRGVDAAFWCLGVSQSAVPDEARYREITLEYTLAAARTLLRSSPEVEFHFLSGTGASADSRMMWARVKAETEAALSTVGFRRLVIWRPAYIHVSAGRPSPSGSERFWALLYPLMRMLPNATNPTDQIASAMLNSLGGEAEYEVLSARQIGQLGVARV
jgi:uncharacterized protein YbjT (DUF2867 family)